MGIDVISTTRPVALVTGAARGIGRVIAQDLVRDCDLALTWATTHPGDLLPAALWIQTDLTQPDAAQNIVHSVMARYGRIDKIVNNAGQVVSSPPEEFDLVALRAMLDVNLLAPQALISAALPYLKTGACVVSLSSVNAVLPPKGAALFGASKAGLDLWTRGLAKELGPRGIRVNAVAPGAVNVQGAERSKDHIAAFEEMTALGRLATAQDIANAVRFLLSDQAASITGETLTVSGGYRL